MRLVSYRHVSLRNLQTVMVMLVTNWPSSLLLLYWERGWPLLEWRLQGNGSCWKLVLKDKIQMFAFLFKPVFTVTFVSIMNAAYWWTAAQHHSLLPVESNHVVMLTTTGETKWTVRGAATGTGPAALSQWGRGARPLAAQHPCHSQLCVSAPKRRPGHGGAAHWLSGETLSLAICP